MVTLLAPMPPARTIGEIGEIEDYNAMRLAVIELRDVVLQNAAEVDSRISSVFAQRLSAVAISGQYASLIGAPGAVTRPGYGENYGGVYGDTSDSAVAAGFGARFGAKFGN